MHFDSTVFLSSLTSTSLAQGAAITIVLTIVSFTFGIGIGLLVALGRDHRWRGRARWRLDLCLGLPRDPHAGPAAVRLERTATARPGTQATAGSRRSWRRRLHCPSTKAPTPPRSSGVACSPSTTARSWPHVPSACRRGARSGGSSRRSSCGSSSRPCPTTSSRCSRSRSLASVISLRELLTNTQLIINSTFQFAELYAAVALWYPRHREHLHGHPGLDRAPLRVDLAGAGGRHVATAQRSDAMSVDPAGRSSPPVGHLLDAGAAARAGRRGRAGDVRAHPGGPRHPQALRPDRGPAGRVPGCPSW